MFIIIISRKPSMVLIHQPSSRQSKYREEGYLDDAMRCDNITSRRRHRPMCLLFGQRMYPWSIEMDDIPIEPKSITPALASC